MDRIVYSDSFMEEVQKLLRKMLVEKLEEISFVHPFENMKMVIGRPQNKSILAVVDIPEDLKEKVGDRKVYVVI